MTTPAASPAPVKAPAMSIERLSIPMPWLLTLTVSLISVLGMLFDMRSVVKSGQESLQKIEVSIGKLAESDGRHNVEIATINATLAHVLRRLAELEKK